MSIRVVCSNCDRALSFPDSEAGLPALCNACGTRFTVPHAGPPELPTQAEPPPAPWAPQAPAERAASPMWWIGGATLALLLVVGICASLWILRHPKTHVQANTWEQVNGARVLSLKGDAEALVIAGKPQEAYAKYEELKQLVGDHAISDSVLNGQIAEAEVDRQTLLDKALSRAGRAEHPAAAPGDRTTEEAAVSEPRPSPEPAPVSVASSVGPNSVMPQEPSKPPAPAGAATQAAQQLFHITKSHSAITAIPGTITDDEIGRAIQKGVDYLITNFGNGHQIGDGRNGGDAAPGLAGGVGRRRAAVAFRSGGAEASGLDALAVYTLIQCGDAINDDRLNVQHGDFMAGCISTLKTLDMGRFQTYGRGLRATGLALLNRKEDAECLKEDVKWLLAADSLGGYSYEKSNGQWDNSNSQYGLLGVWAGAEVGVEVPLAYWQRIEKHWTDCQETDGQWGYSGYGGGGRLSMTLAGVASLFVAHDYLDAVRFDGAVGRDPFTPALKKALDWLETGDHLVDRDRGGFPGYTMYGIERVGLASGFKFFGAHDWYRELARDVIDDQEGNGGWSNMIETCYSLLFLARGRHPVIMNKLRFDGFWANRPRDMANLARFAGSELERTINWQVVGLNHDWVDWTDSPILYLASHQPPKLTDADVDKIRDFVLAGGLLYTQADGASAAFNAFAVNLAHKLFPDYEMKMVPPESELYNVFYKITPNSGGLGPLRCVSNGARVLMVHSSTDLAMFWQQRTEKSHAPVFQFGVNMFIYAAGKSDLQKRLNSPYIPPQQRASGGKVRVARIKYPGNWDPEPSAWPRFVRWLAHDTSLTLDVQSVDMAALTSTSAPVAHLTGTFHYRPTEAETTALRNYVEAGGTLVIDCCGGENDFNDSMIHDIVPKAFGECRPRLLAPTHPLRKPGLSGMDDLTGRTTVRPFTIAKIGSSAATIEIFSAGKGHVIYTSLDLVSGLLGTKTWGILGFDPAFCQSFFKNVILWTAYGAKD